jgi:hypothetical protein
MLLDETCCEPSTSDVHQHVNTLRIQQIHSVVIANEFTTMLLIFFQYENVVCRLE